MRRFACITRAKVLFLDNLSTLAPDLGENDNDEWRRINGRLLHLRRLGVMVIILDHSGKDFAHRGASRKEDNTFWGLKLTNKKPGGFSGARFLSEFDKNRNDPGWFRAHNMVICL